MDRFSNEKTGPDRNRDPGDPGNQAAAKGLAGEASQPGMRRRLCRWPYAALALSKVRESHVWGRWAFG
jgi:hypothetical protein